MKQFILITAVLFFLGMAAHAETVNIEKLNFELGMQNLKQDNLREAIKYFTLVIGKNPKNTEAHYNLAVTYKKLGRHEEALKHFNTVVQQLNSPPEPESEFAKIARLKRQNAENFDVYNRVKEKESDYIDLGDMHADNEQCKAAIEYYNLALKVNPYNDNTYFKVSRCYIGLEDYDMAEPYIRRALELDANNSKYLYYRDMVAQKADSQNRIVMRNFNEIDPFKEFEDKHYEKELYRDKLPEKTLITEYYEDNDKKEILQKLSRQGYTDFTDKQSQELDYIDLGDLHFDNRDYETAVEYYQKALEINAGNDYTYYKLSRCYIELKDFGKADYNIEKALSLSGRNRTYVYFKNRIADTIAGKPPGDKMASEPPQWGYQAKPSLLDRVKKTLSSIRMPSMPDVDLKMPDMPDIKIPKLEGKVEKAHTPEKEKEDIFNRDLKRYRIDKKFPQTPPVEDKSYAKGGYNEKGIEFFKANNLQKAEDYFKKAVQLMPRDPRGYNNLANVEFKRGNLLRAREYALKSVETDPQFPQGYYNLALISRKEKDFESEIYYLNRAISANPKYYQAYFARGMAYYNRGNSEKAKYNFTEVLSLRNDHYLASQNLGIVYANELNYPQAEKYLRQAVGLNKNNSQSYFYLGYVQQNSGKIIDSIENLQRALEINPLNYRTYVELSRSYVANNQPERALQILRNAAEKMPGNAEIYNYLGLMNLKFDRHDDACLAFGKAVRKNPDRPIYHYNLSQCYLCLGKRKESNLAFQRAVSIIPITVQDYIDLAEIFFDRGMTAYSVETLRNGISQLAGSDYLYLVLSDFYERTGAKKAARDVLEEYLNKKDFQESTFSLLVRKRLNELEN